MIPTAHMRYVKREEEVHFPGEFLKIKKVLVLQQLWCNPIGDDTHFYPAAWLIKQAAGEWRDIPIVEEPENG